MTIKPDHPILSAEFYYDSKQGRKEHKFIALGDALNKLADLRGKDFADNLRENWIDLAESWPIRDAGPVRENADGLNERANKLQTAINALEWLRSNYRRTGEKVFGPMIETLKREHGIAVRVGGRFSKEVKGRRKGRGADEGVNPLYRAAVANLEYYILSLMHDLHNMIEIPWPPNEKDRERSIVSFINICAGLEHLKDINPIETMGSIHDLLQFESLAGDSSMRPGKLFLKLPEAIKEHQQEIGALIKRIEDEQNRKTPDLGGINQLMNDYNKLTSTSALKKLQQDIQAALNRGRLGVR